MGKCVGLTQPAVTERVRRLEENGIITDYRTVVSHEKMGMNTVTFMLFRTTQCNSFIDYCHQLITNC
ncbi:Lrp/AsnC family transcriptional regulator [Paenibacillus sp. OSY-SE]|uniref:Lrp/AsnC family transcriptional regulator n=1 Tax=Paenibacillus sp. OSY-SE TaxID=1196323 RepID=UPI003FCE83C1